MKPAMAMNKPTRLLAGMAAMMGTLLTFGGPLALAEHYAQAGAAGNPGGYSATLTTTRVVCPNPEHPRTAAIPGPHQARHASAEETA